MPNDKKSRLKDLLLALRLIPTEAKKARKHNVYYNIQENHSLNTTLQALTKICSGERSEDTLPAQLASLQNYLKDIQTHIPELNLNEFPMPVLAILQELQQS